MIRILILIILEMLPFFGIGQDVDCLPYIETTQDPANAVCVFIDCRSGDCDEFFSRIDDYTNLDALEIINLDRDYFPRDLSSLNQLHSLTIVQSPGLNFTNLFRKLAGAKSLNRLVLDNNGIRVLPKTIIMMQSISSLVIRNNENFEVEKALQIMSRLPNLKELALPVNQLSDLPECIALLKNLEILDLSDNQLIDLPSRMGSMDSLEVLNIEKNVLVNPVKTLEKLKGLNIKYLSMDVCMTDKEMEKLSKIFPKAEIIEIVDTVSNMDDGSNIYDYFEVDSISGYDSSDFEYRTIIVDGAKFRALSDAYLRYPVIFDKPNFLNTFDSLLFEERYMDTTYSNVWKIQAWRNYDNIRLYLFKGGEKGEIWFDFHKDYKKTSFPDAYITKNNAEILTFLGLKWVYQGTLTKNQFVSKYIKKGKTYKYWMDARIYFNERDKNFTIELKDNKGFSQFNAYVRNRSQLISIEKSQESYEYYFERYTKALDNRRKRFHKRLFKDKSAYDITLMRSKINAWESFRKNYMSLEEQRMSMKNWLEYYDQVIADEKAALENSAPCISLFERNLQLNGFNNANNTALLADTNKMKGVYGMFRDEQKNMVAAVSVVLINIDEKFYRSFDGSLGLKNIRLYFKIPYRYAIVAELRNGDIGILKPVNFSQITLRHNKEYVFTLEKLSRKIFTIGQISNMIGL